MVWTQELCHKYVNYDYPGESSPEKDCLGRLWLTFRQPERKSSSESSEKWNVRRWYDYRNTDSNIWKQPFTDHSLLVLMVFLFQIPPWQPQSCLSLATFWLTARGPAFIWWRQSSFQLFWGRFSRSSSRSHTQIYLLYLFFFSWTFEPVHILRKRRDPGDEFVETHGDWNEKLSFPKVFIFRLYEYTFENGLWSTSFENLYFFLKDVRMSEKRMRIINL